MATTDGIFVDGECVVEGDTTGPRSAQALLRDPAVEVAVLKTARGGLIRGGPGYDLCDVAVVTNISRDYLGQDNIETVDDLVFVKSLVQQVGKIGGQMLDKIVLKEDRDPRGRPRGEAAEILLRGVREGAKEKEVVTILDEAEAVEYALQESCCGDLVVIFYEKLTPVIQVLNKYIKLRQVEQQDGSRRKISEREGKNKQEKKEKLANNTR